MPPKSKRRLTAKQREERKKAANNNSPAATGNESYNPPQYRPLDSSLRPYWDAFYENPYPNADERIEMSKRLNLSPQVVQQWFIMARRFTHAPDKNSDEYSDEAELQEVEIEGSDDEGESIEGTLYENFYQGITTQKSNNLSMLKRKWPNTEGTAQEHASKSQVIAPKSTHHRGPRGPYTKQSPVTIWRREKHARKHASPIQSFFPVIGRAAKKPRVESPVPPDPLAPNHIVISDSENESEPEVVLVERREENLEDRLGGEAEVNEVVEQTGPNLLDSKNESMTLESYHSALGLLELSMNRLKLNAPVPIEPLPSDPIALSSTNEHRESDQRPLSPSHTEHERHLPIPTAKYQPGPQEEGPTPQDATEATIVEPVDVDLLEQLDEDERDEPFEVALDRHLKRLLNTEKKSRKPNPKRLIELTTLSDYNNLRNLYVNAGSKSPSVLASNRIAEAKFVPTPAKPVYQHESWFARRLRVKAYHLVRFGSLPESNQGKGASHYSILGEEDVRRSILIYLRTLKTGTISPMKLKQAVNQEIFPQLGISMSISENTARRWIVRLGYRPVKHSKGMYMDGHERSDVVEYRKVFLDLVKALQPLMQQYDDKTDEPLPLKLPEGKKRHVAITHDECCFHANERVDTVWLMEGEQQLRQKGRGRLIHVSDFIVEQFGRLVLTPEMLEINKSLPPGERLEVTEARKIIEPGKNYDKYWDMDQLCEQLSHVLKIFERMYPGCIGVFFFDQSSAHNAFADDALVATRMTVGGAGKNSKVMHDTFIPMDNPNPELRGKRQSMVYPLGHKDAGKAKGMKDVLQERGLLSTLERGSRGQPVGVCSTCSQSEEARAKAEKVAREQMQSDPSFYRSLEDTGLDDDPPPQAQERSSTCCMRRCLSLQQDFLDEKPRIQIMIEQAGHQCIFLPKFHCELNPIEMYWGFAKRLFREQSDGTITKARKLVPKCLDAASITTIRHFWRKSWRYMDAYMHGLTGKQAEFAVKKFKSHRRIGKQVMMDITSVLN